MIGIDIKKNATKENDVAVCASNLPPKICADLESAGRKDVAKMISKWINLIPESMLEIRKPLWHHAAILTHNVELTGASQLAGEASGDRREQSCAPC